jgi:hypothetical protein
MQNTNEFDEEVQQVLDFLGGEPLAGSGFEKEEPEPDFLFGEEE